MASLSVEEENYVRMSLLLTGISPRAARTFFDSEFAPACLEATLKKEYNKLLDLKKKHRINQSQWNLLCPRFPDVPDSKTFDVTLMILLLRNLTPVTPPLCGFDLLPSAIETSPAADLARIKHYRNHLAHLDDGKLESGIFNTAWNDITCAVDRLGGQQMKQECDHLKTKPLDQTNQEIMMDIKRSNDEIRGLQTSLKHLKRSHIDMRKSHKILQENHKKVKKSHEMLQEDHAHMTKEMEIMKTSQQDTVPWNIRAHHRQEIREWEQNQTTFLETRATRHILESLPSHNCIIVTGSSGCGKSSNIHQAALHLHDSFGYEIIPVLTGPTDIMNYYNENKNQVFIVDDICGKETINMQTLQVWRDYSEKMEKIFKVAEKDVAGKNDETVLKVSSPKLLLSCRLHIYKEAQFQRISLFTKKECNLLSPELCLLEAERIHMLHKYLPDDIIDNIKQVTENVDYFPLLCKLSKDKTSEEVKKLFTAPLISIKQNINNIIQENKKQFCALVLCIIFNDGFDTDWLKLGSVSERKNMKTDKLEYIVKEFDIDLSKEMHRNSLKDGFSTLNGTYLKLKGTDYRMIHDKIYKMAAVICGQHLTECFIKYAPPEFIQNHFIFESITEIQEKEDLIVLLKDQEEDYFERLLCDLKEHAVTSTFNNAQLISQTFRDKLISFLRKSDVKTVLKSFDTESCIIDNNYDELEYRDKKKHFYTTPLVESATTGYIDIVQFLIVNVKCDVNNPDERGNSPLHKASERGHTAVAKLLLENSADVNQCDEDGQSPLYVACAGAYNDTVELLLQNNADVNRCNEDGQSPLYVACRAGHKDTVELLLQNNADVNRCNINLTSPLSVACQRGHKDIVELLLQNKADVDQPDENGWSPLSYAFEEGQKDTVKLLLQYNADVNQCNEDNESLLYVACAGGDTDIVELLLQYNADVDHCNKDQESPLYAACKNGDIDIVELLLQFDADVNGGHGSPPVYEACRRGHKGIVELLLHNGADVDKSDWDYFLFECQNYD